MVMFYLKDNKVLEKSHVLALDNICGSLKSALRQSSKIVQNRTPGTLKFVFSCFLIMIFFIVNPIIFGEVLTAKNTTFVEI
jgi:hypothetical protein